MKKSFYLFLLIPILYFAQSTKKINITSEKLNFGYQIFAENFQPVPMSASFKFTLENMESSLQDNIIIVIPAKTKKALVANLFPKLPLKAYKYSFRYSSNFGDVTLNTFDENYIYDLPFDKNMTYTVHQGYNGKISHQDQLALDFTFKEGDKIFAAREGIIVDVVENNNTGCGTVECAKFNNKVLIMHPDGTFAEYLHLKQNGAEVIIGDEVTKGQLIGYSGNTGWSTGPHMHFSVFLNRMDSNRIYIKTKFKTSNSSGELLEEKKSYLKNY